MTSALYVPSNLGSTHARHRPEQTAASPGSLAVNMERVTHKQLESAFEMFTEACGKRVARSRDDMGAWRLDGNALGYCVYEVRPSGGVHHPVTGYSSRLTSREMVEALFFSISAIRACRKHRPSRRSRPKGDLKLGISGRRGSGR
jgi:hypothetical protein